MGFKRLLYIFIFLLGTTAHGVEVSTDVRQQVGASYIIEERHPMKMNWPNFTACWGQQSHLSEDLVEGKASDSMQTGTQTVWVDLPGPLGRRAVQATEWSTLFNEKEYSFNIRVKRSKMGGGVVASSSSCVDSTYTYRMAASSTVLRTNLKLVVPKDVWVIRLKGNKIADSRAKYRIFGVQQIKRTKGDQEESPAKEAVLDVKNGYNYFFVKPDENLRLELEYQDTSAEDNPYLADVEVTFLGFNRCDRRFLTEGFNFSAQETRVALESVRSSVVGAEIIKSDEFHDAINFLACLTRPEAIERTIFANDLGGLPEVLATVNGYVDTFLTKEEHDSSSPHASGPEGASLSALKATVEMLRLRLSYAAFMSLKPYCMELPYLAHEQHVEGVSNVRGYVYAHKRFIEMATLLGFTDKVTLEPSLAFSDFYQGLIDGLRAAASFNSDPTRTITYAELLKTVEREKWLAIFSAARAGSKKSIVDEIHYLSYGLPSFAYTKTWEDYFKAIDVLDRSTDLIEAELGDFLNKLVGGSELAINWESLLKRVAAVRLAEGQFLSAFTAAYEKIGGRMSEMDNTVQGEQFAWVMSELHSEHYAVSRHWLKTQYGGVFTPFVSSVENFYTLADGSWTLREVEKCLNLSETE